MDATTATAQAGARLRHRAGLEVLTWPALDAHPLDALVTTRGGGVSAGPYTSLNLGLHVGDTAAAVLENRSRAAAALGARPEDVVWAAQPHCTGAQIVTAADRGRGAGRLEDAVPGVDVLVTADPGTVLAIIVADCVPIVLYDPVAHVLACVHAGWRGTLARVTDAALTAMRSLGTQPADVLAGVGPAIAADRYQVGPEVAEAARACFSGDTAGILRPDGPARWLLDLPAANRRILAEAGVPLAGIHLTTERTGSGPDGMAGLFFSYRDQHPSGRFAALARLRPRSAG
ncbi:MAG: polyphenol oxidase family protein [Actinomycetota bacterium]